MKLQLAGESFSVESCGRAFFVVRSGHKSKLFRRFDFFPYIARVCALWLLAALTLIIRTDFENMTTR